MKRLRSKKRWLRTMRTLKSEISRSVRFLVVAKSIFCHLAQMLMKVKITAAAVAAAHGAHIAAAAK